jgi:hypothetical protein
LSKNAAQSASRTNRGKPTDLREEPKNVFASMPVGSWVWRTVLSDLMHVDATFRALPTLALLPFEFWQGTAIGRKLD